MKAHYQVINEATSQEYEFSHEQLIQWLKFRGMSKGQLEYILEFLEKSKTVALVPDNFKIRKL